MNFKIKVVENIGSDSRVIFGDIGSIRAVTDGVLYDNDGFGWSNNGALFHNIEEVNAYFEDEDEYQTVFELAEEQEGTE